MSARPGGTDSKTKKTFPPIPACYGKVGMLLWKGCNLPKEIEEQVESADLKEECCKRCDDYVTTSLNALGAALAGECPSFCETYHARHKNCGKTQEYTGNVAFEDICFIQPD